MSILKREIYCDQVNGVIRFWDWAIVTTTIGAMIEPFSINPYHTLDSQPVAVDRNDIMRRIDAIHLADHGTDKLVLSGGGSAGINGGNLIFRTGP